MQAFACLEGPVAENYENEYMIISNDDFPAKDTVGSILNDDLYALTLLAPTNCDATYFVFKAVPVLQSATE